MYCHKCGKEISEDAKFCSFCGVGINQTKEKITELEKKDDTLPEKQDKKRKTFKIIKIIVLILAFIAPSISKNEILLLDGIINIFIWLFIFYIISLFVFPKNKKEIIKDSKKENEIEKFEINKKLTKDEKEINKLKIDLGENDGILTAIWTFLILFLISFFIIIITLSIEGLNNKLLTVNFLLLILIFYFILLRLKFTKKNKIIKERLRKLNGKNFQDDKKTVKDIKEIEEY